jgi:uncharacterized membrane protein
MGQSDKLITEYSFREAVAIYLDIWKRFLLRAIITLAGIGVVVLIAPLVASLILSAGMRIFWGILSSAGSFVFEHRLIVGGVFILLAAVIVVLRTARTSSPNKW